ncbi:MAG: hypothetical protein V3V28_07505 [Polaribacter sp.]|uniref:hypothetical protein n=1 Tax=Polaribacter sp. TaxID=1920175 RepID=UPI002F35C011
MKKILLLFILVLSCKKEVYYYPSEDFFEEYSPVEIIIDDLSFEEVTDSIRNGLYRKEKYFIELEDTNFQYRISPFADTGGFIRERNGLFIRNDSLDLIKGIFPISNLSKYLKLHYENNDKEYFYASSYKWAFIKLVLENEDSSKRVKKLLLKIVKTFKETNIDSKDSIKLNILLDYPLERVYLTPPPPSPITKED